MPYNNGGLNKPPLKSMCGYVITLIHLQIVGGIYLFVQ